MFALPFSATISLPQKVKNSGTFPVSAGGPRSQLTPLRQAESPRWGAARDSYQCLLEGTAPPANTRPRLDSRLRCARLAKGCTARCLRSLPNSAGSSSHKSALAYASRVGRFPPTTWKIGLPAALPRMFQRCVDAPQCRDRHPFGYTSASDDSNGPTSAPPAMDLGPAASAANDLRL
jgi:hypothetical protein